MNNLNIHTIKKLLKLRNILDQIGQISWSFSILNKQYPINRITEEQAQEIIIEYQNLVNKVINLLKNEYENGGLGKNTQENS